MLQRAASNAYSWWWASHIRTKQSKWLEQSLQEMEEKVAYVLKLIEEDGDSFAKRAEMYFKNRPELINFVEESYRAHRALAERYDHISKELQNANSTLASAFPDQFHFSMDDDDELGSPRILKKLPVASNSNIPKVPKFPTKNIKAIMALTSKQQHQQPRTAAKSAANAQTLPTSGLSKSQALEEIDKLQKGILMKQTEKEFAKSSYENRVAKYWQIEEEIMEMQENILKLQDEFSVGKIIEDDEARTLMAEAALKSCQETLLQLQEKQESMAADARAERQRIDDARDRLSSLKGIPFRGEDYSFKDEESWISFEGEKGITEEQAKEPEVPQDAVKENFEFSVAVPEMAEKIDELVNKVINLESAVSSQTALIQRLRSETGELQAQIQSLKDENVDLIDSKKMLSSELSEMESSLKMLQDLGRSVENPNSSANSNIDHISESFHGKEGGLSISIPSQEVDGKEENDGTEMEKDLKRVEVEELVIPENQEQSTPRATHLDRNSSKEEDKPITTNDEHSVKKGEQNQPHSTQPEGNASKKDEPATPNDTRVHVNGSQEVPEQIFASKIRVKEQAKQEDDEPNWQQMFVNGLEGKEKVLLAEYTSILRNYKETKKKLNEVEKKSQDDHLELTVQLKELEAASVLKDEAVHSLCQKLSILQKILDENKIAKEIKEVEPAARNVEALTSLEKEVEQIKVVVIDQPGVASPAEEKLRAHIDEILEENLDFWLRFSTSFHQIQKFQSGIEDLRKELSKIEENQKKKKDGSSTPDPSLKSDARAIFKHLKEIQTELNLWVEQSMQLKDELQRRFSQLCSIQEEITRALNDGAEADDMEFTSFQGAKFQGEVLNMQQENNKVADELQAGLDHVTNLQIEVERTLATMNGELGICGSRSQQSEQIRHSGSRNRVPLRSFIFGIKPKRQKQSIFSSVHPALTRKYQQLRTGDSV
ncbi:hypothetical protein Nepgr_026515 [Nepenthes gracilis]|uniref:NAB domain-containing protein n=1 Tax=Nepenthes gracilis TaxID=150966 RepID=A0AAD3Y0G1_NEPGR|nr:hypothetical protein Nepgr_026515 [Nepenthes gracilis]